MHAGKLKQVFMINNKANFVKYFVFFSWKYLILERSEYFSIF